MKRKLLLFISLIGITLAHASTKIGDLYYNLDSSTQTAEVTYLAPLQNSTYVSGRLIIPETIEYGNKTYTVTAIGDRAFSTCANLLNVNIPNSVKTIGFTAFYSCTGLSKITLPNSLISIGYSAFSGCSNLVKLTLPETLISIDYNAFENCNALTEIKLPNSLKAIEKETFKNCTSLEKIEIGNSVSYIGNAAFRDCSNLKEIKLPNSVTSIENNAFYSCKSLTTIEFGAGLISFGDQIFYGCENLRNVYNKAINPQNISPNLFSYVTLYTGSLYVLEESINLFRTAEVWKEFDNIVPMSTIEIKDKTNKIQYFDNDGYEINNHAVTLSLPTPEEREGYQFLKWTVLQSDLEDGIHIQAQYIGEGTEKNLFYLDKDGEEMHSHAVILTLPDPEEIPGYTFQKWVVVGGDLDDGIHVQAQYIDNGLETEVSSMMEDDSIANQKVIRKGQVFILKGDKVFDTSGKEVK